jgi:anti-anti-sigma factor
MIRTFNEGKEMKIAAPNGMTELVRGNDHSLVAQLEPLVRQQNVALDLRAVDRIDAAGIAALISLYGCAHEAGFEFRLCNVGGRVREILALVGLERILLSNTPADAIQASCMARPAA